MKCEDCKFWADNQDVDGAVNECRRMPPTADNRRIGTFPLTKAGCWCGEFKAKPAEKKPGKK